ncbi:hypothetical protein TWF106_006426 [Orbilia oligospora]|uniref:Uncharacterized protein n=1 Tax=Orbilia oligospora TaxID=2813651 RepID=A0A7C8UV52_ORBOL|nr:hypothetical protein TWF106_006426 [Orbilia oligospora]
MDENTINNTGSHIALQGSINNNGIININNVGAARGNKEIKILRTLYKSLEKNRKDRNPDRIPGTCEWLIAHPLFREWRASKSSKMLWISADPGCGKSVLAKYLVDSVLTTTKFRTTCYFFFKDDFEGQGRVTTALCCILFQLFEAKGFLLCKTIIERFDIAGEGFAGSFSELWNALLVAAKEENAGEIVCVLDAIDECKNSDRSQLTRELHKLYSTGTDFNLKFLLTSRSYREIRQGFQRLEVRGSSFIHLQGESEDDMEKISHDIGIFIEARVQDIGDKLKLAKNERSLLLERLKSIPNRTYLWVYLILDLIEGDRNINVNINRSRIIDVTSHLPETLGGAYERILSKSCNSEEAKRLLQIVIAAQRPLTLQEMSLALALKDNHQSYSSLDLRPEERFRDDEFLVRNGQSSPPQNAYRNIQWKNSLQLRDSHQILTDVCIRHLLFAELESNPLAKDMVVSEYVKNYIFLDYSAKYWTTHLQESQIEFEFDNTAVQRILGLCDTSSKCCLTWLRVHWAGTNTDFPENISTLMVASYFGLAAVVRLLLGSSSSIDLNSRDDRYGRSALSWAAGNGFDAVIKHLLKGPLWKGIWLPFRGAVLVDSMDKYHRTPLVYAVLNRQVTVVKQLLGAGARVDLKDDVGGTPLSYAICSGQDEIIKLLFKNRTNADSKNDIAMTLLFSAARKGHEDVVKLLLEIAEVSPDIKDSDGWTPLQWAAEYGHKGIARLLVEKGANIESKDSEYGHTPVSSVARNKCDAVVQLPVDQGADIKVKKERGYTPLIRAAANGHEAVVRLLVENGADIEAKDDGNHTALLRAAGDGYTAIVRLLVDRGADIEAKDSEYNDTPLLWAAQNGHETVVRLLVDRGADIETKDKYNYTPLLQAAQDGHEMVVELLVERGANMEAKDKYGYTPLLRAAANGHEAIVRLLMENGADIEAKDDGNHTALLRAAGDGYTAIVRLLVDRGADTEAKDSEYNDTPLLRERGGQRSIQLQAAIMGFTELVWEDRPTSGKSRRKHIEK